MSEQNSKPYEMTEQQKEDLQEVIDKIERNGGILYAVGYNDGGKDTGSITEVHYGKGMKKGHARQALEMFLEHINA